MMEVIKPLAIRHPSPHTSIIVVDDGDERRREKEEEERERSCDLIGLVTLVCIEGKKKKKEGGGKILLPPHPVCFSFFSGSNRLPF